MDLKLKSYLDERNIDYEKYEHIPVFTVEQSRSIKQKIPATHTKSLFLKDENSQFYLICLPAEKRLNIKFLKKKFNLKELFFASPEELKRELNLTPGSVSLFGMLYSKSVFLIIDKELWNAEKVGFHPNINSSTIVISHEGLEKFFNSINAKKEIVELENG